MKRRIRDVIRDLLGRSDTELVERIDQHIDTVLRAIELIRDSCKKNDDVGHEIDGLEHQGDEQRSEFTQFLSWSLTTPIDREDLFRLSRSIDDVLDNLRDFARELRLYRPPDPSAFVPMLDAIRDAVDVLHAAVAALPDGPESVVDASRKAESAASQVRRGYEDAMAELLDGWTNTESLRQRELLRRLDVVGLRLGEAGNSLADGGLKRLQ
jgi:predicted phosphate transport protein (TIGR00153 family)